jgi:hypothetical protein
MADDEALFFGGFFECEGDIIDRWKICDAEDVHELCFEEIYHYNVCPDYFHNCITGHQDGDNFGRFWRIVFKDRNIIPKISRKIDNIIKHKSVYDTDTDVSQEPVLKYEDILPEHRFDFSGCDEALCTAFDMIAKGVESKLGRVFDYFYHKIIPTIIGYLSRGNHIESIPEDLCSEVMTPHSNIGWFFEASLLHECMIPSVIYILDTYDELTFDKSRWNEYLLKIKA